MLWTAGLGELLCPGAGGFAPFRHVPENTRNKSHFLRNLIKDWIHFAGVPCGFKREIPATRRGDPKYFGRTTLRDEFFARGGMRPLPYWGASV